MEEQGNANGDIRPGLAKFLTPEYERKSKEEFWKIYKEAEHHLEKLGRIVEEMKR